MATIWNETPGDRERRLGGLGRAALKGAGHIVCQQGTRFECAQCGASGRVADDASRVGDIFAATCPIGPDGTIHSAKTQPAPVRTRKR